MDTACDRRKLIAKIMGSLKEYTPEDIIDLEAAKLELGQILETHRAIKLADYEYGLSCSGKQNHCLIIKEGNDKTKVREYSKDHHLWRCSKRNICNSQCIRIQYGIIFAPLNHIKECQPKELLSVMKVQNRRKQRKADGRKKVLPQRKQFLNSTSTQSLSSSILNESNLSTMDMENDSVLDQSVVPKLEPINVDSFPFNRPSDETLTKICEKFSTLSTTKIEYNRLAYKFWAEINFENIPSVSENIQTHSLKSPNIFACFSLFFTGKVNSCFFLHNIINTAFCDDLIASGEMASANIDEIFSSNTVTDQHLEFICKFLSCRIGIYENGILKKYGKWETESNDAFTLILSFKNGFYSVVLDL